MDMTTTTTDLGAGAPNSAGARRAFAFLFATTPTPLMRAFHRRGVLAPVEEIRVVGRRSGIERSFFAVVVDLDGVWYIGHPNGHRAQWVRNLLHAGSGTVVRSDGSSTRVSATELSAGPGRVAVIDAHREAQRQPFRALYGRTRAHVIATGSFFRLDPIA
jgi:hypothetical protein